MRVAAARCEAAHVISRPTAQPTSSEPTTAATDVRDERLTQLREELAKIKTALNAPKHIPTASGDGPDPPTRMGRKCTRAMDVTTAAESDVDEHPS